MISDATSNYRGLAVAFAVMLGVGVTSSQSSALARDGNAVPRSLAGVTVPAPLLGQRGSTPDGAIIVADNNDDNHKNWKGKKSGDNDHNGNGNNKGNWNKNGQNKNWSGNGQNWNGNKNKNWSGNGDNWNGNNKNWNKNGGKNWSKNNHWNNHWNDNWNGRAYVRSWQPRPYYGDFIGGVVLGSILAAAGAGIVPYSPDPDLCWYWADPYMYRGYWDYCY